MNHASKNPIDRTQVVGLLKSPASAPDQPGSAAITGEVCPPETPSRRGAKRGRKPGPPAAGLSRWAGKRASYNSPAPRRRRKLPPGAGALRLLNSVNLILHDESDLIARALVEKTIAGNAASARLLIELACARPRSNDDDEKPNRRTLAEMLMDGPQWEPPPDPNAPRPNESLEDYKIRRLGPNYRLEIEAERKAEAEAEANGTL